MAKFYILKSLDHPWSDYYDILLNGLSGHLDREGGRIQLERTGPFVPPISFPGIGDIVVTDAFRRKLEASGLAGLRFQPVVKKRIVRSDWHTWDRTVEEPAEYPDDGEPESYILEHPHSASTAEQMGDLWELLLNETARAHRATSVRRRTDISLLLDTWQGEDLFRAQGVGYAYATTRARDWLTEHAGEYVTFEVASTKNGG